MENHHFLWENPLFLWPFSIAMLVHQRVIVKVWFSVKNCLQRSPSWCFFKGHPARKGHMRRLLSEGAGRKLMTHDLFILHFYCTEMPSEMFKIIQKTLTSGFQTAPFPAYIPSHKSYLHRCFLHCRVWWPKLNIPDLYIVFSHYKYLFIIHI